MIEAKRMVQKLISRFRTNDPFRIADSLDYIVIFVPLRGIRGFHQYVQRNHIIYIDNSLDEVQQRWVCAHELGHIFLHPHLNKMFLANHTTLSNPATRWRLIASPPASATPTCVRSLTAAPRPKSRNRCSCRRRSLNML